MRRRIAAVSMLVVTIAACASAPSPPPTSTPSATGRPIVIGVPIPPFAPSPFLKTSNAFGFRPPSRAEITTQLVYNGLYRYDESLAPVPDLAAEPCEVKADLVTIVCRIVEATFHDGSRLTADDVAFTFEVGRRNTECLFAFGVCFGEMLTSAKALDERTVEFRLTAPDATFLTLVLPSVFIDSRAVVERAYAPLGERAAKLEAEDYRAAAAAIFEGMGSDEPDCEGPLSDVAGLFEAAGLTSLPRDQFIGSDGKFDACMYAAESAITLELVAASVNDRGLGAIAQAYAALSFNLAPVGTGPWRFVSLEDGTRMILEAHQAYHRGPPATPRIEVRMLRDPNAATEGLRRGELHWVPSSPEVYRQVKDQPGLQFATYPDAAFFMLAYNLRDGMLFADHAVRTAVDLCIDKPATVDAATDGGGDVIYSPIEPVSWAYQPDLPRPERNVEEARRLIEDQGWTEGEDGVYAREGKRLATDVYVRADEAQRVAFMDLVAEQVRDCGIALNVIQADAETVLGPISEYPHIAGGADEPFQAIFLGWGHGFDPHDELWHSRSVTSSLSPRGANFMGFRSPEVDKLLDEGLTTYDQRERARIYREFQEILAEERPVLFGWGARAYEALDARLSLTDGSLNLDSRQWPWELEKLILRDG